MSEFNIEVEGGKAVRLPTAGKYCDRDIVVTATGGGSAAPMWLPYIRGCQNMFDTATFPENTEFVMELPVGAHNFNYMFRGAKGLKSVKLITHPDSNVTTTCMITFSGCDAVRIDLSEFNAVITNWTNAFYGANALEEIIGEIGGQNFGNAFIDCGKLREIRFAEGGILTSISFAECKSLSDASIQSIIDGLADLTGQTAQTLTIRATVGEKLTQAQKDAVSAKNWTLVY